METETDKRTSTQIRICLPICNFDGRNPTFRLPKINQFLMHKQYKKLKIRRVLSYKCSESRLLANTVTTNIILSQIGYFKFTN